MMESADRLTMHRATLAFIALLAAGLSAPDARAVDKQGSAHGGSIADDDGGFAVSGALTLGTSLVNSSYAARPDNTGLVLMRYAGHADVDLIGRRLSIPIDVNLFSDKDQPGARKLSPTELDMISGLTSTFPVGAGAAELGARLEYDRPIDRAGTSQTYADLRARYLYSLIQGVPALADRFRHTDLSGWLTFGWFAYNPSYFARPDNSGKALFRYAAHTELSLLDDLLSVGVDACMFTDRSATNPLRPSELDLTPEIILHGGPFELHLAYELDRPLDRDGLRQRFAYILVVWDFSQLTSSAAFENRGQILSP